MLNKKTIPRIFPILNPEVLFMKVKGAKVFNVIDLLPFKNNNHQKTTLILLWDKYHLKRLPLGLLGAIIEVVVSIFSALPFVVCVF